MPIARAGVAVIGVDSSPEMLSEARAAAAAAGVSQLLDLRLGDLREPRVDERVPLAICPFRSLLHMETESEKLRALRAARELLERGGFGLHWLSAAEWLRLLDEAGLEVDELYGWFDLRPYEEEEDMVFVCRRAG